MFFLLFFVTLVAAYPCTNDRVVKCLKQQVDSNHDQMLDAHELDEWLTKTHCFDRKRSVFTGQEVVRLCDANQNGYLDVGDMDHRKSCLKNTNYLYVLCHLCDTCTIKNTK